MTDRTIPGRISGLHVQLPLAALAALAAGCLDPGTGAPPDDPLEGTWGEVRARTPDGPRTLTYQVQGGHAIHEGDIDLGPIEQLAVRGGAIDLADRWPDGVIRYAFDANFTGTVCDATQTTCEPVRTRVRDALATLEAMTPLRFAEVTTSYTGDFVQYRFAALDFDGGQSSVGMQGGMQSIKFSDFLWEGLTTHHQPSGDMVIMHETLHAAGMWHEQSRPDRDQFVEVSYECIADGYEGNFNVASGATVVGPYDFNSIMHYGRYTFCAKAEEGGACICPTLTPLVPTAVIQNDGRPSVQDVATLYRIYGRKLADDDSGDRFGYAVAAGDFDGDGYTDVAVGMPYDDFNNVERAGAVMLLRGSVFGLQPWQILSLVDTPYALGDGDLFGYSLVALDVDRTTGSGNAADLAIGAPGRADGVGAVYLFRGHVDGRPTFDSIIRQSSLGAGTNVAGDRFGASLAAGRITGRIEDTLVVGAPDDEIATTGLGILARAGAVYLYHWRTVDGDLVLNKPTRIVHSLAAGGTEFGASLAVGDLDNDGKQDLVVGEPGYATDDGAVSLYKGQLPPETDGSAWSPMVTLGIRYLPGIADSRFGDAVAVGNLVGSVEGLGEIAVGAPRFTDDNYGLVRVLSGGFTPTWLATVLDPTFEVNDMFGAVLGIGRVVGNDTRADLVVGTPREDGVAGAITVVSGGATTLGTPTAYTQATFSGSSEAGDNFGFAIAFGDVDRAGLLPSTAHVGPMYPDLIVGLPGEGNGFAGPADAGAIWWMPGGPAGFATPKSYYQESDPSLP